MFLADSYVLVGGVFLQCLYQKMSVVIILQVPFINRNPQQVVGISMFEPWKPKTKGFATDCLGLSWPNSISGKALYPHSAFELILGFYM